MPQVTFVRSAPTGPIPSRFHPIRPTAATVPKVLGSAARTRSTGLAFFAAVRSAQEFGIQPEDWRKMKPSISGHGQQQQQQLLKS
ncbi:hypothetical protein CORC01_14028 [Colletotrichum orchidophilum]|uniref:Uncharacterized protein n=1 Tax=Colletotrichum orchidophilum TaxID=1209926 RepID=A0A1G4ANC9_9PEZI|nr:uncharacterized protein CORC01_14028 [Colletotrichum orchidophilum]OHE90667.1 hypothetical protein CORC01_14028 [Colletotrichum orchidophilum]